MSHFFVAARSARSVPLVALSKKRYGAWLKRQPAFVRHWLEENRFDAAPEKFCAVPSKQGGIGLAVCGIENTGIWSLAHLPAVLPPQTYRLEGEFSPEEATRMALGWALSCYRFTRYKTSKQKFATLVAPQGCDLPYVNAMAEAIFWARDLINTPANDMNPAALAAEAAQFGKDAGGKVTVIRGEDLLEANYPTIYAVGKASEFPPYLVDIRFPRKGARKVTLVGKGVCFDSGGLDIKSSSGMRLMKKDMAGVAIALALAKTLLAENIDIELRLLLPIVENAVSGNAARPLDIVKTRSGLTVEIGNTDAEGRLILCDALFEADQEAPDLIIDFSTLTGAARVALGAEIPAFFTPDDALADAVAAHAKAEHDPLWRLPLWKPYLKHMESRFADLSNDSDSAYGGAITAALYLQEFVSKTPSWLHLDMMAWNLKTQPGRPLGGEAMGVRAMHALIKERYGNG